MDQLEKQDLDYEEFVPSSKREVTDYDLFRSRERQKERDEQARLQKESEANKSKNILVVGAIAGAVALYYVKKNAPDEDTKRARECLKAVKSMTYTNMGPMSAEQIKELVKEGLAITADGVRDMLSNNPWPEGFVSSAEVVLRQAELPFTGVLTLETAARLLKEMLTEHPEYSDRALVSDEQAKQKISAWLNEKSKTDSALFWCGPYSADKYVRVCQMTMKTASESYYDSLMDDAQEWYEDGFVYVFGIKVDEKRSLTYCKQHICDNVAPVLIDNLYSLFISCARCYTQSAPVYFMETKRTSDLEGKVLVGDFIDKNYAKTMFNICYSPSESGTINEDRLNKLMEEQS